MDSFNNGGIMQIELTENTFNIIVQMVNSDALIPAKSAIHVANAQAELRAAAEKYNAEKPNP
jgi:hypothetical protein